MPTGFLPLLVLLSSCYCNTENSSKSCPGMVDVLARARDWDLANGWLDKLSSANSQIRYQPLDWLRVLAHAVPSAKLTTWLRTNSHQVSAYICHIRENSPEHLIHGESPIILSQQLVYFLHNTTTIIAYLYAFLYLSLPLDYKCHESRIISLMITTLISSTNIESGPQQSRINTQTSK